MIIDQLPLLGGDAQGTDEFPIERGTTTYKATLEQIFATVYSAIEPNFAGAYDSTATYAVGDYVVHSHKLYRCTTAITTAEAWTAAHWTQVDVAGELSAIYLGKQDTLISGTNIKTVGGQSLLGSGNIDAGGDVTADMLGIVINGNSTPVGASVGQYVIVKNSTISDITDDLYTAALPIPASTAIDATYLTKVSGGGLNAVKSDAQWHLLWTNPSPNSAFSAQTISLDLTNYTDIKVESYGYATTGYFGLIAFGFKGTHRNTILGYFNISAVGTIGLTSRDFICEDTGIEFFEGYSKAVDVSTAGTVENLRCVPIRIYAR